MDKGIVHTRTVSTLLIVICIVVSAGLSGYFLDLYSIQGEIVNEGPTADAGESLIIGYPGVPITFNGNGSFDLDGEIISYTWDFGDGFTGIGIKPTHTYEDKGDFTVTLTIMDNDGAEDSVEITARITEDETGTGIYTRATVSDILADPNSYNGDLVLLQEVLVTDAGSFTSGYGDDPTGWVKFYVSDATRAGDTLEVYCEAGADRPVSLSNGAIVNVTGQIASYNGVWELKVRSDSTDKVVVSSGGSGGGNTSGYTQYTLAYINTNYQSMLNDQVCVIGATITSTYTGDGFMIIDIIDSTVSEDFVVFCDLDASIAAGIGTGDVIDVYGVLAEYENAPEIKVREGTADKIELGTGGGITTNYTQATVSQLLLTPDTYNDSLVCVLGALVTDYYNGGSFLKVTVTDNSTSGELIAFGFPGVAIAVVSPGDYVDVYGNYEWYATGGYFEIMIRDGTDDRVVLSAGGGGGGGNITGNYTQATVNQLLTDTDTYDGADVCVLGALVTDYYDGGSFIKVTITDNSTSDELVTIGFDGSNIAVVSAGDYVDVYGEFMYYDTGEYWEIKINSDSDDRIVLSAGGGGNVTGKYTEATLDELLSDTGTYADTLVSVLWAEVTDYYDGGSFIKVTVTDNSTSDTLVTIGFDGSDIATVSVGDYVDVYGEFIYYDAGSYWEIKINSDSDDRIVVAGTGGGGGGGTGDYTEATIDELLSNTGTYADSLVFIGWAEVTDYYDGGSFVKVTITDNSTSDTLVTIGFDGSDIATVSVGDYVDVYGEFIYYDAGSYWEIKINSDSDDRIVVAGTGGGGGGGTGDYTEATIDELLSNTGTYEDTLVYVGWAEVTDYYDGGSFVKVTITDNSTSDTLVTIGFDGSDIPVVSVGDYVDVYGEFLYYDAGSYWEIKINSDSDDQIVLAGTGGGGGGGGVYDEYDLDTLLSSSATYDGNHVAVLNAEIVDLYNPSYTKITITDTSTSEELIVFCSSGADVDTIAIGDIINIYGTFKYFDEGGYYEIEVASDSDDHVDFVSSGGGGGGGTEYTIATIDELLSDTGTYADTLVYVGWAEVTDYYDGGSFVKVTITDNSTSNTLVTIGFDGSDIPVVSVGNIVDVYGEFLYYDAGSYWEIKINSDSDDGIELISTGGGGGGGTGDYTEATVNELLTDSGTYEDSLVYIGWAEVTDFYIGASFTKVTFRDNSTSNTLIAIGFEGSDIDSASIGNFVDVYGEFMYYDTGGYWEIMINADSDDRVELVGTGGGGGGGGTGSGTAADPYDVAGCIANQDSSQHWVMGHIVGHVKDGINTVDSSSDINWDGPFDRATHVALADDINENDYTKLVFVALPYGTDLRDSVNLVDNPEIRGMMLNVTGAFKSYFGRPGVRDDPEGIMGDYELWGEPGGTGGGGAGTDYTEVTLDELLSNTGTYADTLVSVLWAEVTDYYDGGSFIKVTITDNSTSETLVTIGFSGSDIATVSVGDWVDVYGEFMYYDSGSYWEIKINSDSDDRIVVAGTGGGGGGDEYTAVNLYDLLENTGTYEDSLVFVGWAQVTEYYVGSSYIKVTITDNTTSSELITIGFSGADIATVSAGDWVDVYGEFTYYDTGGYWEIMINSDSDDRIILAESGGGGGGTEPPEPQAGYTEITLDELFTNSSAYLDTNISIVDARISDAYSYNLGLGANPFDWVIFFITDSTTAQSIKVYCEPWATRPLGLSFWDEVNVYGVLGEQYSTLEIVVRNNGDDLVEQMSNGYRVITLDDILDNSDDFMGREVCLLGASVTDAFSYNGGYGGLASDFVMFYVSDMTSMNSLQISCEPYATRPLALTDGAAVDIFGILDEHYGVLEIVVRNGESDNVAIGIASGSSMVYYVTDHGADIGNHSNFANAVNAAGLPYMEGTLASATLDDVALLIISNPTTPYTAGELAIIQSYVVGGGSLLVLCESDDGNAGMPENCNPILEYMGIEGRFNDDQMEDVKYCYDMWSTPTPYNPYNKYIPYFNAYNYNNPAVEYQDQHCLENDTTGMSSNTYWLMGKSICTLYNTSNDIVVVQGSDNAYNVDNTAGEYFHSYPKSGYPYNNFPPTFAANDSIGSGRVIYGGFAATFNDNNADGWSMSNITDFVIGLVDWAEDGVLDVSGNNPSIDDEPIITSPLADSPGILIELESIVQTRTMVTISRRN